MSEEDIQEYHNIGRAIKKSEKYKYINGIQSTDHGSRIYDVAGYRLPSVTTVLGKTKNQQFFLNISIKVICKTKRWIMMLKETFIKFTDT